MKHGNYLLNLDGNISISRDRNASTSNAPICIHMWQFLKSLDARSMVLCFPGACAAEIYLPFLYKIPIYFLWRCYIPSTHLPIYIWYCCANVRHNSELLFLLSKGNRLQTLLPEALACLCIDFHQMNPSLWCSLYCILCNLYSRVALHPDKSVWC